jgi:polysaccharide deacetylase 2 family uncharacterized protein YibQ
VEAPPPNPVKTPARPAAGETPLPAEPETEVAKPGGPEPAGRVALVIDDLGRDLTELATLKGLGIPLSYAVLPFEAETAPVVAALRQEHAEILCHLPMEPENDRLHDPGPGALRLGMSESELRDLTAAALAAVPGATGVNNHMGSGLSADPRSMRSILGVLAAKNLFFLDSRTSARSVGYRVASALGIPAAERHVFLDDDERPEAVEAQFARLLTLARSKGAAIAIGHPHPATLEILAREVPKAREAGFQFVPVSFLLDRPGSPD